ncbi:MAG TPA: hypothetical protein VI895_04320 [Bdellovibrionota bacterium]|nr:hypothetical protein [Bdellovibrionota bacterium]
MAGPRRFNLVNIFIYLLIGAGFYLSFQYVPVFWKKQQLQELIKEESYAAKRKTPEQTIESIVNSAQRQLAVALDPEDLKVEKFSDRVRISVLWRVTIEHPFDIVVAHNFRLREETVFY